MLFIERLLNKFGLFWQVASAVANTALLCEEEASLFSKRPFLIKACSNEAVPATFCIVTKLSVTEFIKLLPWLLLFKAQLKKSRFAKTVSRPIAVENKSLKVACDLELFAVEFRYCALVAKTFAEV